MNENNTQGGERAIGVILLIGGCITGWMGILSPLLDALNHEPYVSYNEEIAGLTGICLPMGLIYLILGPKIHTTLTGNRVWVLIVIIVLLAIFFGYLPDYLLSSMGYS